MPRLQHTVKSFSNCVDGGASAVNPVQKLRDTATAGSISAQNLVDCIFSGFLWIAVCNYTCSTVYNSTQNSTNFRSRCDDHGILCLVHEL